MGARAVGHAGRRDALRQRDELRCAAGPFAARRPHGHRAALRLSGAAHLQVHRDRAAGLGLRARRRFERPQRAEPEDEPAGALDVRPAARHDPARSAARDGQRLDAADAQQPEPGATRRRPRGGRRRLPGGGLRTLYRRVRSEKRPAGSRAHARLRQYLGRRELRRRVLGLARLQRCAYSDRSGQVRRARRAARRRRQARDRQPALPVGDPAPVHRHLHGLGQHELRRAGNAEPAPERARARRIPCRRRDAQQPAGRDERSPDHGRRAGQRCAVDVGGEHRKTALPRQADQMARADASPHGPRRRHARRTRRRRRARRGPGRRTALPQGASVANAAQPGHEAARFQRRADPRGAGKPRHERLEGASSHRVCDAGQPARQGPAHGLRP